MSWSFDVDVEVASAAERALFWIDLPRSGTTVYGDQLEVAGWAFAVDDPATEIEVEVEVGGHRTTRLTPTRRRDDVAAAHPRFPGALRSGFALLASIPRAAQTEVAVSIVLANERIRAATIALGGHASEKWSSVDAPLVSVVIPCYNHGRFLREAIESVRRQTYPRVELVVVDDGSSDNTSAVAASLGVHCIRQQNRGLAAARNRGAAEATGEYVVFLDADDRLLPDGLEANADAFADRPQATLVSGWFRYMTSSGEPIPWSSPPPTPPERDHYAALLETSYYIACPASAMYRHQAFLAAGGFDGSYPVMEDFELYLRIAREHPMFVHSVPVAEYRRRPGSMSRDAARMLEWGLATLRAQPTWVRRDASLRAAYSRGVARCHQIYGEQVAQDLKNAIRGRDWHAASSAACLLARRYPRGLAHAIGGSQQPATDAHDSPTEELDALSARARDQAGEFARIEARLGVLAQPPTTAARAASSGQPVALLEGTRVTPRAGSEDGPPRLTVITSTYNQERYVADAIESVLAQRTNFPIQLIVTDDASTDSTPEIIETYRSRNPNLITVIRSERNGWYFANILRALALTDTDYFTLLDADDYWTDETYLQRGVDFLESHPEFVIYSANCFREGPEGSRILFISGDAPDDEFCFEDYLQKRALATQTTGTLFRNLFFRSGVPKVFSDMLRTEEQYSFACDFDRYAIHLEKGKARFENRAVGVYRVTSDGMWAGLNEFEKYLWEAKAKLDHWRYFAYRHPEFFLGEALSWSERCLEVMRDVASGTNADIRITPQQAADLRHVVEECHAQITALIEAQQPAYR